MSLPDPRTVKKVKEALATTTVKAYCKSCGKVFLEIPALQYFQLSSQFQNGTPDKWFVETGIHWSETDHMMHVEFIMETGEIGYSYCINLVWDVKLKQDLEVNPVTSKTYMRPHFYKYRELCKDKPI